MNLSPAQIGVLMVVLFFILMYLKMPIGVSLLIAGFVGFFLVRGMPAALASLGIISWRQGMKEILLLIPLFTLMGMLSAAGGISSEAFSSIYKWVGHFRGGLAMACTGACAAFGAVCGNALATSLTMNAVAYPEMKKYHYRNAFSVACIAASGNLGIMIPPSGSFVFYGFLTETSIGALFIAGILPGLLITALFWIQMYVQCRVDPSIGPAGPRFGWIERLKSIKGLWAILLVFLLVMGGIYAGVFTPNEGASVGVFVVFLIGLLNRQLKWKPFISAIQQTMVITGMIMLMIIGAMYFGAFIAASKIPSVLADLVTTLAINRYFVMFAILIVYFILGCIMDMFPVLAVTLPIFFPIIVEFGFDPLQFGVLCVLMIMLGGITPPFGMQVFAIGGLYKEVPTWSIFRECMPFIYSQLVAMFIIVFVPAVSLLLPNYMIPYR